MDPIRRRESVCRSLFGPVDHDQLRRDLEQKLKEITEQDSRRWNFNFQTETPLPGSFQWEEIPADCTASLYQESTTLKDPVCSSHYKDDENCSSICNTHKSPAEVTPVRWKRTLSKAAAKPRNNARITGEEQTLEPYRAPSYDKLIQLQKFRDFTPVFYKLFIFFVFSDFFAKRRRTTETKTFLNPFRTSSSETVLCKTIR